MKFSKRKFTKILCFSTLLLLFPIKTLLATTKKIVNPNLSKEQKNIMFNEGTERPFTSNLLKEKRKGFYHCANCGNNSLHQLLNLTAVLAGLLFLRLYQVLSKQK
mgnify:CR=1 FL=1